MNKRDPKLIKEAWKVDDKGEVIPNPNYHGNKNKTFYNNVYNLPTISRFIALSN